MSDYTLSPQQLQVICALSSGATLTAAAAEAGIHRNTIAAWRRNQLPFQHALADAFYDRAMHYREKLEELVDLAVQAIHQLLAGPLTPPSVRLRAALAVMQLSTTPPPPKQQVELILESVAVQPAPKTAQPPMHNADEKLHKTAQPPAHEPTQKLHNPAQSPAHEPTQKPHNPAQSPSHQPTQKLHNPAQSPLRREHPKIGRNQPCPCASGLKYKHCCLGKPLPAAA